MKNQQRNASSLNMMVLVGVLGLFLMGGYTKGRITHAEISPVQTITHDGFQNIDSIVLDEAGRIYISDIHSVKVFNSAGDLVTDIGSQGTGQGEFTNEVIGLAINSRNELFIVDQDGTRVQVFDLQGNYLRSFGEKGNSDGQFQEPQGITVDTLDLVYVADKKRNDIQIFSRGGEYLYSFGKSGAPGSDLNEPESMAIHQERLYVADEENRRVQIYDLRGKHLGHLPHSGVFNLDSQLEASLDDVVNHTDVENKFHRYLDGDIEGVAFDGKGLLYILNEDAGEIIVFQKEKMVGVFTSSVPVLSGDGMAFDSQLLHLYVVDQGNSQIQVFDVQVIHDLLGI